MSERIRPISEQAAGGGGAGIFDGQDGFNRLVTVSSGPYLEHLPVAAMPIGEIRRRFADRFDIDPNAQAVLDGQPAADEAIVHAGQALMFVRRAGEKGTS